MENGEASQRVSRPVNCRQVTLQVGERRFVTMGDTLEHESGLFAALLSGRWNNAQADGSYFIDADPELFEHLLRYFRRGVLPVFYDNVKGHDHALYHALLQEARYFQIPRLENWLSRKGYLDVIKINCSARAMENVDYAETLTAENQVEYHPDWETRKVYICPRDILVHRGRPDSCGRACDDAQGDDDSIYEDEMVLKMLVVRKQTVVDSEAWTEGLAWRPEPWRPEAGTEGLVFKTEAEAEASEPLHKIPRLDH